VNTWSSHSQTRLYSEKNDVRAIREPLEIGCGEHFVGQSEIDLPRVLMVVDRSDSFSFVDLEEAHGTVTV